MEPFTEIVNFLNTTCSLRLIYVFGSASKETTHPESDIDIAFLPSVKVSPMELFAWSNQLSTLVHKQVDLIDLSGTSTVMRKEVVAHGKILFSVNNFEKDQFEMLALSDYARLNEERAEILQAL